MTPAPTRVLRRPAVLALVAVAAVVLAGLGWTLLSSGSEPTGTASTLLRPRAGSPAVTPSPSLGATGPGGTVPRNPFANQADPAVTAPTTPPHVVSTPAAPGPTGGETPRASATGTATPTSPATGGPSAAPTVTVTVTNAAAPTYVGLYAWNGSRASFRVNARTYSVHVGTRFGPGLTFSAVVRGDPPCARVTHAKGSFTLCPGQVTTLP